MCRGRWLRSDANLVHWTRMTSGGHFAPMEEPDLLVQDIRDFVRPLRSG